MRNNDSHLREGTLLQGGRYRIVRFIGSGGFGCTYEAEHTVLGVRVAVKEFFVRDFCNRDGSTSRVSVATESKKELVSRLRRKFIEEAKALYRLRHPGIVRVSDVFEENGTAYYVMDYIAGKSLQDLLKQYGRLPESEALGYIRQVSEALRYVHGHNRLHLDIKPGNIMVDGSGSAVLIDFGASKQYDEANGENTSTLLGHTPGYAPPEQVGNSVRQFTPSTDIYALGATLYKLLTGETPVESTLRISGEYMAPLPVGISPSTRSAVESAMALDKRFRPQSVGEFLRLLGQGTVADEDAGKDGTEHDHGADATRLDVSGPEKELGQVSGKREHRKRSHPELSRESGQNRQWRSSLRRLGWVVGAACVVVGAVLGYYLVGRGGAPDMSSERSDSVRISEMLRRKRDSLQHIEDSLRESNARASREAAAAARELQEMRERQERERAAAEAAARATTGRLQGYAWVDLGLSVRWATCNVGASSPSDYGNYYAWGETTAKSSYTEDNSRTLGVSLGDISGNPSYDAATANWGSGWRMPTRAEFEELVDKCTWEWTSRGGHDGYEVTGPNGKSIFLPAAGWRYGTSLYGTGGDGYYWSSTPYGGSTLGAYGLYFNSGYRSVDWSYRLYGHGVRPVSDK